jgi:hypothetical protein
MLAVVSDPLQTALVTLASVVGVAVAGGSWKLAATLGQLSKTVELLDKRLERLEMESR